MSNAYKSKKAAEFNQPPFASSEPTGHYIESLTTVLKKNMGNAHLYVISKCMTLSLNLDQFIGDIVGFVNGQFSGK